MLLLIIAEYSGGRLFKSTTPVGSRVNEVTVQENSVGDGGSA